MDEIELLAKLKQLLKNHDWYHQYSDDNRVYKQGVKQMDEIQEVMLHLELLSDDAFDKAEILWSKYDPR
jgi:hypothetical protein